MAITRMILSVASGLSNIFPLLLPYLTLIYILGVIASMVATVTLVIETFGSAGMKTITAVFGGVGVALIGVTIYQWAQLRRRWRPQDPQPQPQPQPDNASDTKHGTACEVIEIMGDVAESINDIVSVATNSTNDVANDCVSLDLDPPLLFRSVTNEKAASGFGSRPTVRRRRFGDLFHPSTGPNKLLPVGEHTVGGLVLMLLIMLMLLGAMYTDWVLASALGVWSGLPSYKDDEHNVYIWVYFWGQKLIGLTGLLGAW